jgi:uncharacterized phosphatase
MSTKLFLIRHAQTEWNAQGRIQGSLEQPLNEVGREQALSLGERLAAHPVTAIYSSPMLRARQTAEILAQFHECELQFDPALREISYGIAEGLTRDEFRFKFGPEIARRDKLSQEERLGFKIPQDGESAAEAISRALPALTSIFKRHPGGHLLVVSHGFIIRSLLAFLGGYDEREIAVSNAGWVHLEGDASELRIVGHFGIQKTNH